MPTPPDVKVPTEQPPSCSELTQQVVKGFSDIFAKFDESQAETDKQIEALVGDINSRLESFSARLKQMEERHEHLHSRVMQLAYPTGKRQAVVKKSVSFSLPSYNYSSETPHDTSIDVRLSAPQDFSLLSSSVLNNAGKGIVSEFAGVETSTKKGLEDKDTEPPTVPPPSARKKKTVRFKLQEEEEPKGTEKILCDKATIETKEDHCPSELTTPSPEEKPGQLESQKEMTPAPSFNFIIPSFTYKLTFNIFLCNIGIKDGRPKIATALNLSGVGLAIGMTEEQGKQREGNTECSLQRRYLLPLWIFKENLKPD